MLKSFLSTLRNQDTGSAPSDVSVRVRRNPEDRYWQHLAGTGDDSDLLDRIAERLNASLPGLQEHSWEAIYNAIPEGLCVTDSQSSIKQSNRAFRALMQIDTEKEIATQNISILLRRAAPHGSDAVRSHIDNGSESFVCELRRGDELEDGVLRVARVPLSGDSARPNGSVWMVRDITHQRLAEEVRNQFVCTATHELRTPLANLRAYAETLAREDSIDIEKQKEFCNIIHVEATRLSRFVDELLNISRMEGGALSVVRHETDIARLLQEVIDHIRPQMDYRSQKFESVLPARLPKLNVDKDKLSGALINLLGNASKYTPEGGNIRFEAHVGKDDIALHVEDSGYGISPEDLPRIFDKFYRSGDERVRKVEGSGLGLAFSREVARLHGGRLTVTSELNRGSRFTLTLPLA